MVVSIEINKMIGFIMYTKGSRIIAKNPFLVNVASNIKTKGIRVKIEERITFKRNILLYSGCFSFSFTTNSYSSNNFISQKKED